VKQEDIDAIEGLKQYLRITKEIPEEEIESHIRDVLDAAKHTGFSIADICIFAPIVLMGITYRVPVSASAASSSLKDIIQKISDNRIREARQGKEGEA
jgi:hypothetical protein